jgi:hypothetical protein
MTHSPLFSPNEPALPETSIVDIKALAYIRTGFMLLILANLSVIVCSAFFIFRKVDDEQKAWSFVCIALPAVAYAILMQKASFKLKLDGKHARALRNTSYSLWVLTIILIIKMPIHSIEYAGELIVIFLLILVYVYQPLYGIYSLLWTSSLPDICKVRDTPKLTKWYWVALCPIIPIVSLVAATYYWKLLRRMSQNVQATSRQHSRPRCGIDTPNAASVE